MAEKTYPKIAKAVGAGLNLYGLVNAKGAAKKALEIFCTPRGGQVKPYQEKYLNTFKSKQITFNDFYIQVYYKDNGYSQTILFAHGWESNSARWKKLQKYISDLPYNIVMLDGPAHGKSGSKYFNGLLYAEMISTVAKEFHANVLIGHSIGAFSCMASSYFFPQSSVSHLIILASPDSLAELTEQYFDIIGLGSKVATAYYTHFTEWFPHELSYFAASNFVKHIDLPGLLIHDTTDSINGYHNGQAIAASWEKCQFVTTNGFGHGLQTKDVYEEVKQYLSKKIQ